MLSEVTAPRRRPVTGGEPARSAGAAPPPQSAPITPIDLGVALVVGPWIVRQKLVFGITTISSTSADLLYAGALGQEWGGALFEELEAAGTDGSVRGQSRSPHGSPGGQPRSRSPRPRAREHDLGADRAVDHDHHQPKRIEGGREAAAGGAAMIVLLPIVLRAIWLGMWGARRKLGHTI